MVRRTHGKTLLEGFGEATEQVVALRAENERLRTLLARFLSHHEIAECSHAISTCVDLEGQAREVLGKP